MKWKPDWFLFGMLVAVVLAWLFPTPGAAGGWLHPELVTKGGVALIFFLHGMALSFAALKAGTLRWPVHLAVQASTFLVFPLLGIALLWLFGRWISPDLRLGFLYLCALPSTVSSSVAMTAAARGNVAVAVFNATLSSLIGVFLTPLWMGAFVQASGGGGLPLGKVILDLIYWLVLPLVAGQMVRPLLGAWAGRNKPLINKIDRGTILMLVYTSFCDSFKEGIWSEHGVWTPLVGLAGSLVIFVLAMTSISAICRWAKFPEAEKIAAIFCGSKKTMASGVPMAKLMFGTHPSLGMILLPIMIYHPLQLFICGVLAGRWAKRTE
ncbi:MAG: bile acid:sodium symporter family protein [Nibricoccus sp.]